MEETWQLVNWSILRQRGCQSLQATCCKQKVSLVLEWQSLMKKLNENHWMHSCHEEHLATAPGFDYSLPHWGSCHSCVRGLSLPEDHSLSQASPSPPAKGLSCVPALSPNLGGGKQCLHHAASMGNINMSTWSMGSCLWLWHWALSASPASILEKKKYLFKMVLKLAIYAAPSKEDSSGVPHSLLTLTELHFRDQR